AAEHGEVRLVDHRAVVEDAEHEVLGGFGPHLGDEDLDLHRLHLVGEDLAEDLRVLVREAAGVDVLAAVRVALEVGVADARDAQGVELVVATDPGEADAVVDLAHLAEPLGVLGADEDALLAHQCDEAAATGDALAGVVGPVLHHLFGCDVERHAHEALPSVPPSAPGTVRSAMRARNRSATSSFATRVNPSAVMVATVGKMPRTRSGPPVAESSSAAWKRAEIARSMASSRESPSRQPSFTTVPAWSEPDPVAA